MPAPFGVAWKLYGNGSEVPVGCNEILDKKSGHKAYKQIIGDFVQMIWLEMDDFKNLVNP